MLLAEGWNVGVFVRIDHQKRPHTDFTYRFIDQCFISPGGYLYTQVTKQTTQCIQDHPVNIVPSKLKPQQQKYRSYSYKHKRGLLCGVNKNYQEQALKARV